MGATYEYVLNARADDCERVGSTIGHEKYGFEPKRLYSRDSIRKI